MKKTISLALLASGSRLTIFGVSEYASARPDNSRGYAGSSADIAKWMLIGAVAVTVLGLAGLLHTSKPA